MRITIPKKYVSLASAVRHGADLDLDCHQSVVVTLNPAKLTEVQRGLLASIIDAGGVVHRDLPPETCAGRVLGLLLSKPGAEGLVEALDRLEQNRAALVAREAEARAERRAVADADITKALATPATKSVPVGLSWAGEIRTGGDGMVKSTITLPALEYVGSSYLLCASLELREAYESRQREIDAERESAVAAEAERLRPLLAAAREKDLAERAARESALAAEDLAALTGNPEALERYTAGVLPEAELMRALKQHYLPTIGGRTNTPHIGRGDLPDSSRGYGRCDGTHDERGSVSVISCEEEKELAAREWAQLKAVRASLPEGATARIVDERLECERCDAGIDRRVIITELTLRSGRKLRRRYEVE